MKHVTPNKLIIGETYFYYNSNWTQSPNDNKKWAGYFKCEQLNGYRDDIYIFELDKDEFLSHVADVV